ncbi:hypothetical protein ZWY2020_023793 [Hordeum vulgare]|nr:hypothetical protein ZWY2020_023793 [Hordeum vulgare]
MGSSTQDHRYPSVVAQPVVEGRRRCSGCEYCWLCCIGLAAMATVCFFLDQTHGMTPYYTIAINSVSGLDPSTDLGRRSALDPEFSLTLRVASHKRWASECAKPDMYVDVFYRGVFLAASMTTGEQICARPKKAVDHPTMARGIGVVVPGPMLDSLAGDMRRGVQVFDVMLHGSDAKHSHWSWYRGGRRVGNAGALGAECISD